MFNSGEDIGNSEKQSQKSKNTPEKVGGERERERGNERGKAERAI